MRSGFCGMVIARQLEVEPTGGGRALREAPRHVSFWVVIAVLLLLAGGRYLRAQQQELTQAISLYNQGHIREAEPLLQNILRSHPRNGTANETLGLIYAGQGELERALPYLSRAAQVPSSPAIYHANLGVAYLKLGRTAAALPELKTAAQLDPTNAETASELGQAYVLNHEPKDAAAAFAAAARLAPPSADLLYNWALALSESRATRQAAAVLARIPKSDMSAEADSLNGDLQERLGHYMAAVHSYQSAADKDPSEANLYALTVEFLRHWTWGEAQKVAEFARTKYPASRRIQLALGIAYYGGGHYSQAAGIFSDLLTQAPENNTYADLLGRSCSSISEGQSAACIQLITFAIHHPKNAAAAVYAAENILHQPGEQNLSSAKHLLSNAIASNPRLPTAYYQMGVLDQRQLKWKASAAMLEKAVALNPSLASAHYRLARAYARMGNMKKAKEEIALQRKYSQQETNQLDANLKSITIFLPTSEK